MTSHLWSKILPFGLTEGLTQGRMDLYVEFGSQTKNISIKVRFVEAHFDSKNIALISMTLSKIMSSNMVTCLHMSHFLTGQLN